MGQGRLARRFLLASLVTVAALMASASLAGAAVTIGQVAPTTPAVDCGENQDLLQPTVTSGNAYIVPAGTGAITSWSTNADADADQMLTMKVFRKIGDPATYQVVGHDGPHPLSPGVLNTFPASVAVMPGDVLGLHVPSNPSLGSPSCRFSASGDTYLFKGGNLADGQSDVFAPGIANSRSNVSAVVEADCDKDGLGDETQDTNLSSCAPGITPPPTTGQAPTLPSGAPATCRGIAATIVGTDGSDVRTGSQGQDVVVALGGNDTLSGLGGNDVICGGAGKDTLKGGKGKDSLLGQKGKDALNGGPGRDFCKGGKGTDTASKCEVEKSI
jgi:Ca2+-binding RTX toxin-like protein